MEVKDKSFSPAREETNPSFQCNKDYGYDYGGGQRYDVFALYQLRHGCDFPTAFNDLKARAGIMARPRGPRPRKSMRRFLIPIRTAKMSLHTIIRTKPERLSTKTLGMNQ